MLSMSPRENRAATSMPKPVQPFRATLNIIARGTFSEGFLTSSDI